ncbi:MAG: hypothetical protein KIT33_06125 [Candidatus Kapabacteria bacterium]|nr:hypothetical protein [Ignavibacteriota bacterium]MCW5884533.1 hypothetical protein [Candidatus Kapabacteria bacterium]
MLNEYKNIDVSKTLSIQENLRKSIVVTTGSSLIAAFIFLFVYVITKNIWMLSLGIILAISGFAFMFVIKNLQKKYADILNDEKGSRNA